MQIVVNGASHELPTGISLQQLLAELAIGTGGRIAIEVNGEIVPRSSFQQQLLQHGDRVEIVHAIGGG